MRLAQGLRWRRIESCHHDLGRRLLHATHQRLAKKSICLQGKLKNQHTALRRDESDAPGTSDPSAQYLHSDTSCTPIMIRAREFFSRIPASATKSPLTPFQIHLGAKTEWRCVAKLAVRHQPLVMGRGAEESEDYSLPAIGLFAPGTHRVVSTPSAAHHPAVEAALQAVRAACLHCGLLGYHEAASLPSNTNTAIRKSKSPKKKMKKTKSKINKREGGYLKYLLFNVDAIASCVQLTLVWDSPPPFHFSVTDTMTHSQQHSEQVLSSFLQALRDLNQNPHRYIAPGKSGEVESAPSAHGASGSGSNSTLAPIDSLWVHYNPTLGSSSMAENSCLNENSITSKTPGSWRHISGPGAIYESLLLPSPTVASSAADELKVARLVYPPYVFRQANSKAFQKIIFSIRHWIAALTTSDLLRNARKPRCIELYGGVGTIGLNCIDLIEELHCSDENPFNQACFEETVLSLPAQHRAKATYTTSSAADMLLRPPPSCSSFDILVVDPPRKGLDVEVLRALTNSTGGVSGRKKNSASHNSTILSTVKRVIYVSCGFKSFQRDASLLLGWDVGHCAPFPANGKQQDTFINGGAGRTISATVGGGWQLVHAEGHVLFPGSDHLETLAIFDRI